MLAQFLDSQLPKSNTNSLPGSIPRLQPLGVCVYPCISKIQNGYVGVKMNPSVPYNVSGLKTALGFK